LFYAFWGMTMLLIGTFVVGGAHTLLWLPKAIQMRRELKAEKKAQENNSSESNSAEGEGK
jgi:hypothetical protein